ncbi:hypothetical protein GCM10010099_22670 [Streptomyces cinereus]|nr:hypothetical protein GCM10010099_22670 [Streptomyces cinereus]
MNDLNATTDIKKLISQELQKESPNWLAIERLSSFLVDNNDEFVRFKVDAGHINKLGLELVGKQETAIIELIKNAYDADATHVTVDFINSEFEGGTLIIEDNGSGMDLETVKNAWMKISTDFKVQEKISPFYNRVRAGRKGIGRFAVQRLGTKLVLKTKVKNSTQSLEITFNWENEYKSGNDIRNIVNTIHYNSEDQNKHGTRLEIYNLREAWTDSQLKKVWNGVINLQSPFEVVPVLNNRKNGNFDPGFETVINKISSSSKRAELSIDNMFLENALASIEGQISNEGVVKFLLDSPKLNFKESFELPRRFDLTGEVHFKIKYFIYRSEYLAMNQKTANNIANEFAGIRIYRNGFRVLPYGERSDDWLKLDRDVARRSFLVPGSNTNFFGAIYINDDNELFEETSNREGLLENSAFQQLAEAVREVIETSIFKIGELRNRKKTSGQQNFVSELIPNKKPTEIIGNLKEDVLLIANDNTKTEQEKADYISKKIDVAHTELEEYEEIEKQKIDQYLEYEEMLRILAAIGMSVSIFGHEIKSALDFLNGPISLLKLQLKKFDKNSELNETVYKIESASNTIFDIGKYIGHITNNQSSRKMSKLNLNGIITSYFDQFSEHLRKQTIEVKLEFNDTYVETIAMHESEIISILLNFTTNSIKFLRNSKVQNPLIRVNTFLDNDFVNLIFEDNGVGIEPQNRNKVFDAFYTTSLNTQDILEGIGTGLGLKIVYDIVNSYGGEVKVIDSTEGFKASFALKIPRGDKVND